MGDHALQNKKFHFQVIFTVSVFATNNQGTKSVKEICLKLAVEMSGQQCY